MPPKKPACDPCRLAKVACDHKHPVCGRCVEYERPSLCVYRSRPFAKRRRQAIKTPDIVRATLPATPELDDTGSDLRTRSSNVVTDIRSPHPLPKSVSHGLYPNPGHQGSSSYAAIFNEVRSTRNILSEDAPLESDFSTEGVGQDSHFSRSELHSAMSSASRILQQLLSRCSFSSMKALIDFWLAKGVSLVLAEPLVQSCRDAVVSVERTWSKEHGASHTELLHHLLENSLRPLFLTVSSTLQDFLTQICGTNVRLEALGLFLCAAVRATTEVAFFHPLYTSDEARLELRRLLTRLADVIMDLCLGLDCLNDLQLVLQYEHFLVHSNVSGDQSLRTWRYLGDAIASLFALGYHENVAAPRRLPNFLIELRKSAYARIFNSDKSFATFLGRPPRISKRTTNFQLPSAQSDWDSPVNTAAEMAELGFWDPMTPPSYRAEARWGALCASSKEEILEMLLGGDRSSCTSKAKDIIALTEQLWSRLPSAFQLSGRFKDCHGSMFEKDFVLSIRLYYLHLQFLANLVLLPSLAAPSNEILSISEEILLLIVEATLQRHLLANAGSGIVWKIAQFGLPAAGVILLGALRDRQALGSRKYPGNEVRRNLSILVAEVQLGSVIGPHEPNYSLLSTAMRTIQIFINSWESETLAHSDGGPVWQLDTGGNDELSSLYLNSESWNLELGFWQDLAEHPFLGVDPGGEARPLGS